MATVTVTDQGDAIAAATGSNLQACWEALANDLNTLAGDGVNPIQPAEVHAYYESMGFDVTITK